MFGNVSWQRALSQIIPANGAFSRGRCLSHRVESDPMQKATERATLFAPRNRNTARLNVKFNITEDLKDSPDCCSVLVRSQSYTVVSPVQKNNNK